MLEALSLIAQVSQAASPFLLALAVWAFATGKVVPRWLYDQQREDLERAQRLAEGGTNLTERSLRLKEPPQSRTDRRS